MVTEGPGGVGTRIIRNSYPVEEGLILGTTKLSDEPNLIPEENDLIPKKEEVGL
jgi:hypothetical protein